MTEKQHQVDREFQKLTQPKTPLPGLVIAWALAVGVIVAVTLGCIALAKVVL